jgi:hypothetical protein
MAWRGQKGGFMWRRRRRRDWKKPFFWVVGVSALIAVEAAVLVWLFPFRGPEQFRERVRHVEEVRFLIDV